MILERLFSWRVLCKTLLFIQGLALTILKKMPAIEGPRQTQDRGSALVRAGWASLRGGPWAKIGRPRASRKQPLDNRYLNGKMFPARFFTIKNLDNTYSYGKMSSTKSFDEKTFGQHTFLR